MIRPFARGRRWSVLPGMLGRTAYSLLIAASLLFVGFLSTRLVNDLHNGQPFTQADGVDLLKIALFLIAVGVAVYRIGRGAGPRK